MNLKNTQDDGRYFSEQLGADKGFIVTFDKTTPESVDAGEFSESGFSDYDSCEPDESDTADGLSAVDKAIEYLRDKGATEPSSSHFHKGIWYSAGWDTDDYRTGEEAQSSYHPKNFTVAEEQAIFDAVKGAN